MDLRCQWPSPLLLQSPDPTGVAKTPGQYFTLAPDDGGSVWISSGNGNGSSALYRLAGGKAESRIPQEGEMSVAYRARDKTFCSAAREGCGTW